MHMSVYSVIDFVLIVLQLGVYRRHLKKLHAILLELVEKRTLTVLYFDMSFLKKNKKNHCSKSTFVKSWVTVFCDGMLSPKLFMTAL